MKEFELKYGCNPNQKPARIYMSNGVVKISSPSCSTQPGWGKNWVNSR